MFIDPNVVHDTMFNRLPVAQFWNNVVLV